MIKTRKKFKTLFIMWALCVSLVACSKDENQDMTNTTAATIVQEPKSEQEYRAALENLGTDKRDMELALEYYGALWQMDAFLEEDFDGLSQAYNQLGNTEMMRETLIRKHTYYPSVDNIELISSTVLIKDTGSEEVSELINETVEYLNEKTYDNVKNQILSEKWQQLMQDDLVGVTRRTKYIGEGYEAQIESDINYTTIFLIQNNTITYYKLSEAGMVCGTAVWENSNYNGDFDICYYSKEGSLIKKCRGTFVDAIAVGNIEIDYDGSTYLGTLDSEGKVTSEQIEEVTKQGGLVYAYSQSGDTYLYKEAADVDTFVIDNTYLGLPLYEQW